MNLSQKIRLSIQIIQPFFSAFGVCFFRYSDSAGRNSIEIISEIILLDHLVMSYPHAKKAIGFDFAGSPNDMFQ